MRERKVTMSEREKEMLIKATNALYSLSCRVDSKMEERRLEKLAESLEQVIEDYSEEE